MKELEVFYGGLGGGGKTFLGLSNFMSEVSLIHIKSVAMKDYLRNLKRRGRLTRMPRGCQ